MALFNSTKRFLARTYNYGSRVLDFCFTLLCLRFIGASFYEAQGYSLPTLFLVGIYFGLACWRPKAALFIYILSVPWLSGLSKTQLLSSGSTLFLGFGALWLGSLTRRVVDLRDSEVKNSCESFRSATRRAILAVDLLSAVLLLSAIATLWPDRHEIKLWSTLIYSPSLGFGDRYYTLHAVFLWLQGLLFLKLLLVICKSLQIRSLIGDKFLNIYTKEPETKSLCAKNTNSLGAWIYPIIIAYVITILGFSTFQYFTKIPDTYFYGFLLSPYEDIHSLGGISVALWASIISIISTRRNCFFSVQLLGLLALSILIIMTYSRVSWLAAAVVVLILVGLRYKTKWLMLTMLGSTTIWWMANESANRGGPWTNNPYLVRLHGLIRIESLSAKSSARFEIYHKAMGMIQSRPWTGHGIGSFYLTSPKFALKNDPMGAEPNFAHNFILQFAAELGIPATLLFCSLIGAAWYKGFRITRADLKAKNGNRIPLALFLALTTYLITQMTANSLNIYVSHQFLFWFLIAALLTLPESKAENRPNAIR